MTREEIIKVLQTIEDRAIDFPYMTACDWVAIAAAKRHLQEEPVNEDLDLGCGVIWKCEETVSEDLEQAAITAADEDMQERQIMEESNENRQLYSRIFRRGFKAGAQWQKEHLWKPADSENLPEIDREVIVLTQSYPLEGSEFAVSFAHRPNPKGWDGKSITTGKVEHYTPKTYGNGGWNIPDVIFWLDVDLPKIEEF